MPSATGVVVVRLTGLLGCDSLSSGIDAGHFIGIRRVRRCSPGSEKAEAVGVKTAVDGPHPASVAAIDAIADGLRPCCPANRRQSGWATRA